MRNTYLGKVFECTDLRVVFTDLKVSLTRRDKQTHEEWSDKTEKWLNAHAGLQSLLSDFEAATEEEIKVVTAYGSIEEQANAILMSDVAKVLITIISVFVFMWVYTGSCMLAAVGLIEILLSIPVSILAWAIMGNEIF